MNVSCSTVRCASGFCSSDSSKGGGVIIILNPEGKKRSQAVSFVLPALLLVALIGWLIVQPSGLQAASWRSLTTVFVSILLEALPFLVLGIFISSLIEKIMPSKNCRCKYKKFIIFMWKKLST